MPFSPTVDPRLLCHPDPSHPQAQSLLRKPRGKPQEGVLCGPRLPTRSSLGSSGPCVVICVSIAAVREVGETLQALGLTTQTLHTKIKAQSFAYRDQTPSESASPIARVPPSTQVEGRRHPSLRSEAKISAQRRPSTT